MVKFTSMNQAILNWSEFAGDFSSQPARLEPRHYMTQQAPIRRPGDIWSSYTQQPERVMTPDLHSHSSYSISHNRRSSSPHGFASLRSSSSLALPKTSDESVGPPGGSTDAYLAMLQVRGQEAGGAGPHGLLAPSGGARERSFAETIRHWNQGTALLPDASSSPPPAAASSSSLFSPRRDSLSSLRPPADAARPAVASSSSYYKDYDLMLNVSNSRAAAQQSNSVLYSSMPAANDPSSVRKSLSEFASSRFPAAAGYESSSFQTSGSRSENTETSRRGKDEAAAQKEVHLRDLQEIERRLEGYNRTMKTLMEERDASREQVKKLEEEVVKLRQDNQTLERSLASSQDTIAILRESESSYKKLHAEYLRELSLLKDEVLAIHQSSSSSSSRLLLPDLRDGRSFGFQAPHGTFGGFPSSMPSRPEALSRTAAGGARTESWSIHADMEERRGWESMLDPTGTEPQFTEVILQQEISGLDLNLDLDGSLNVLSKVV
uniref:Uncharacterized protein n=1 Tax=Hanusia phi TaxID=3032 RepID=A0A7S0ERA9_9CRYP